MKLLMLFIIAFFFCLQPLSSIAEMYMWTDENGVKHYGNIKPGENGDVKKLEEKDTVDDSELRKQRERHRRAIEKQNRKNQIRDAREKRQEVIDEHNLSNYERQKDLSQRRANRYETLVKERKQDLDRAEEQYNDVKRESYSNRDRHENKVNLYKNRIKTIESDIELYTEKVEYYKDQADEYQDKIDRID